jgi:hypothetical protein
VGKSESGGLVPLLWLLLELQFVSGNLGVCFLGIGVDAAAESSGIVKSVSDEIGRGVENFITGVVVENDQGFLALMTKNFLEKVIAEELGSRERDGLMFFASPKIEESTLFFSFEEFREVGRFDQDLLIGFMSGKNMFDHLFDGEVFVPFANLGEGFGVVVAAALASPNVVAGKEGAFRPGKAGKDFTHGDFAVDGGSFY